MELTLSIYNPLMAEQFEKDNYKITVTGNKKKTNRCFVFFSSNGIYFPNEEEVFKQQMVEKDYYEWLNISTNPKITKYVDKIIFVRDTYKIWYQYGINNLVNSVDKLAEFLKEETKGYETYTIGSSAGGYAAALFGAKINAKAAFSNSAQFDISITDGVGYQPIVELLKENIIDDTYFNITGKLGNIPVFYLCPINSTQDEIQYNLVKSLDNIHPFIFPCDKHGATIHGANWPFLLTTPVDRLIKLSNGLNHKSIDINKFGVKSCFAWALGKIFG